MMNTNEDDRLKAGDIIIFKTKVKQRPDGELYGTIKELRDEYFKDASADPFLEMVDIEVIQS